MTTSPTPPTPPGTPPRPVKSSEEYFNSSRLKVIGMITAATVAVGALGGIAGVVFDPDPVPKDHVHQPGAPSSGVRLAPQTMGSPGNSSPRGGHRLAAAVRLPGADATATPSPLGSVSPGSGGFSDSPTASASSGTESSAPTESSSPSPSDGGTGVTMSATGVDVYVPPGWSVDNQNDNQVYMSDGAGSFAFAFSVVDDPSTAAGDVITQNLDGLLPSENYTQLQTSDVVPLQPFGSVVSLAGIEYEALWVDNQGSISIHGQIYVGVRQDGTILGIVVEHVPAEDFEAAFEDMVPILDNSFNRFGGVG